MERRLMQLAEFRHLYDTQMGNHFPADEIKPFYIMEKAVKEENTSHMDIMKTAACQLTPAC